MSPVATFRPRARLVSILGEHLISDHVVGLVELVKNAYDADAGTVRVALSGLADPKQTVVIVEDDGCGMSLADLTDKFLCPATDHKAQSKRMQQRTPRGRLPLGEKGVGRFAAQQLGLQLEVVTRAAGLPEAVARIDWSKFERSDLFLDDVEVEVEERAPALFQQTGTRLTISQARRAWTRKDVEKLQRGLRRLRSPNFRLDDFQVRFQCPEYPDLEDIHASDILESSHYTFRASYDSMDDQLEYEYLVSHPDVAGREATDTVQSFSARGRQELSGPRPCCGSFFLNLHVWDRTPRYLASSGVSATDLNAHAGVSLFRDRMRVFPYGEPGNDWLHLDHDRIQNPSERIGNNQVVGFVEIDQSTCPDLIDKTNREGLIENPAFRDLRALVRSAIQLFTTLWSQDRPETRRPDDRTKQVEPPEKPLKKARALASALTRSAREDIAVQLPSEKSEARLSVNQIQASRMLEKQLGEVSQATDHQTKQQDILLALAATGMAAERVVHEFGRQVARAVQALTDLRHGREPEAALSVLQACLGELRNEFRVLAPYPGAPGERVSKVELAEAIEVARALNDNQLDLLGVELSVRGEPFSVRMRPASLIQVLDNLIFNSLYWLESTEDDREIVLDLEPRGRELRVRDSGPGIAEEVRATVFEPFVSTRPGGRGLGLYIVRELLRSASATIDLEEAHVGASFVIRFPGES